MCVRCCAHFLRHKKTQKVTVTVTVITLVLGVWCGKSRHHLGLFACVLHSCVHEVPGCRPCCVIFGDGVALTCFAKCCEGAKGGLSKVPNTHPDLLHSYYALAGLALARSLGEQLRALDARLGITSRACDAAGLRTPETAPPAGSCLPCDDDVDPMRNGDSR